MAVIFWCVRLDDVCNGHMATTWMLKPNGNNIIHVLVLLILFYEYCGYL